MRLKPLNKMPKISLLLPTRHRFDRAVAFLESVVATAAQLSSIEVLLAIDKDDQESQHILSPHPKLLIRKIIGPQTTMGGLNTRLLHQAKGEIIMLVNDDIIIRTPNWDRYFIQSSQIFPDQIYLMHTKDGFKNHAFPIFPILSKHCCHLIKDPYPREFCGDGIDLHLFDIFIRLKNLGHERIIYLENVFFEHMHVCLGKAKQDAIYRSRSHLKGNYTFYALWEFREQITKLLCQTIEGHKNKQILITKKLKNQSRISLLLNCFLRSQQTLTYRTKYFCYHLIRETYLLLRLDILKWFLKRSFKKLFST